MRKSRYIYQNKLDKACFQYDVAYGDFEDLNRKTVSDKALCDKQFNIVKNHVWTWAYFNVFNFFW